MYLNMAAPPASTTIQISGLARPGALLETEAVAILPPAVAAVAERRRPARAARRAKATAKKNAKKKSSRPAKRSRK
jgi:hypothetical protein